MSDTVSEAGSTGHWDFAVRIDEVCDRFEAAWKGGQRPRIEDYLEDSPAPARVALLRELVPLDMEYRKRQGETPSEKEYLDRFPYLSTEDFSYRPDSAIPAGQPVDSPEDEKESSFPTLPPTSPEYAAPAFSTAQGPSRYTPKAFHKKGGLGEVYKAYDEELRREVALKRIKEEHSHNPVCQRDFLREAEITGKLEHPGVVPIYGLVQGPDGNPSYAMRFIEGESLKDAIHKFHEADKAKRDPGERAVALRQLLNRFIAVCNTLAFAHNRGIIHRDLKPANIMLGKYGETLVVDWGLARPFARTESERASGEETLIPALKDGQAPDGTKLGDLKGTLAYMSPEQAEGRWDVVGPASDIYSLGATLYELLTGVAPMRGGDYLEVLSKAQRADFPRPRSVKSVIAKPLEAVCLKAMSRDRTERYPTADLIGKDLELWLADEPVSAYREPWRLRLRRLSRRHRTLVASLAAAILVTFLLGGGAWGWLVWKQQIMAREVKALLENAEEILQHPEKDPRLAQHLLDQAKARMADGGPVELQDRLEARQRDLDLAKRLEDAWLRSANIVEGRFDYRGADRLYTGAFAEIGPELSAENGPQVAEAIQASLISRWLIMALDHWAYCKDHIEGESGTELRALADGADDDDWRHQFRTSIFPLNPRGLAQLAQDETSLRKAPADLLLLGIALRSTGNLEAAETWFRLAVERQPQDFWINLELAATLHEKKPPEMAEAMQFLQAARALRPENPAVLVNRGSAWGEKKEYGRAISDFDEAIRLDPMFALAFSGRGAAWTGKKEYEQAIHDLDEAIRLDPREAGAFNNRGIAWSHKKEYDRAISDFHEAIRLDPEDAKAFNNRGVAWSEKKEYDRAISDYGEAIRRDPKYARAFNHRGNAWSEKKEYDRAMRDYDEAIQLDPNDATAFSNRGIARRRMKEYDLAIRDYDEAIRLDPKYAGAHNNRGIALYEMKQLDEAIREYRTAIELDPKLASAHYNLGNALRNKGQVDDAIREHRTAIELDPMDAKAHNNLGNALRDKKQLEEAIREYSAAIELDPKDAAAHQNLAIALYDKKDLDKAIREYRTAIELDPNDAKAHCYLGMALYNKKHLDEAVREFYTAIELDPRDATAHNELGMALADKNQLDQAIREFRTAIELDPKRPPAHTNLGIALADKKQLGDAIREFRTAIELDPRYVNAYGSLGDALMALGRFAEAQKATRDCLELLSRDDPRYQLAKRQLQRCEQLLALDKKLPAILEGKDAPAGNGERLAVAWICQQPFKKLYAASARFYGEAFEQDANPVKNTQQQHRYNAACVAAMAGCGRGNDADKLDDKDLVRLRNQSRAWLRADLGAWAKLADQGKADDRATAEQALQHWQTDSELAGVRDKEALATLPETEQEAWRKLWADVGRLLNKIEESKR